MLDDGIWMVTEAVLLACKVTRRSGYGERKAPGFIPSMVAEGGEVDAFWRGEEYSIKRRFLRRKEIMYIGERMFALRELMGGSDFALRELALVGHRGCCPIGRMVFNNKHIIFDSMEFCHILVLDILPEVGASLNVQLH